MLPAIPLPPVPYDIQDSRISIRFCNVSPGHEHAHAQNLLRNYPNTLLCKVFGKPDIAIIQEIPSTPGAVLSDYTLRDLPNIHDITELICYKHPGSADLSELAHYPLLCIAFIKIHPATIRMDGYAAEFDAVSAIRRLLNETHTNGSYALAALSSPGWHETITLIACQVYSPVLRALVKLQSNAEHNLTEGDLTPPHLSRSMTFPCLILNNSVFLNNGSQSESAAPSVSDRVKVTLFVSGKRLPGYGFHIIETAKKLFEPHYLDCSILFGEPDFVIRLAPITSLDDYAERLWEFRKQVSAWINWTSTMMSLDYTPEDHGVEERHHASEQEFPSVHYLPTESQPDSPLQILRTTSPTVSARLAQTLKSYNTAIVHTWTSEACQPLVAFMDALAPIFTEKSQIPPKRAPDKNYYLTYPDFLAEQLDVFEYGLSQYQWGTPGTFLRPDLQYSLGAVGIQRALIAAGHVIASILESAQQQWTGFVICGYSGGYRRYHGGVVDMPWEVIDSPEHWWGLYHEAGHELGGIIDITLHPDIKRTLIRRNRGSFDALIWEVFSEIAALELGFGINNWDLFVKTAWKYYQKFDRYESELGVQFLRWLFVSGYVQLKRSSTSLRKESDWRLAAEELFEVTRTYTPKLIEQNLSLKRIAQAAHQLSDACEIFANIFTDIGNTYTDESEGYAGFIGKGYILPSVSNPSNLIVQLIKDPVKTPNKRWLVLLSLWHAAITAPDRRRRGGASA
jgi:hypothetical protein